jgi:hypothetical protein
MSYIYIYIYVYDISHLRVKAVAVPYSATCKIIQESCMLAIECSPTKTRHRQKSRNTAGLTCTKSMSYKILENYGHETFTHMRMFVCLHICVSPSVLNQRIDLCKI